MDLVWGLNGPSESLTVIGSDYGSDIDDDTWDAALVQAESNPLAEVAITDLQDLGVINDDPRLLSLRLTSSQKASPKVSAEQENEAIPQGGSTPSQAPIDRTECQSRSPSRLQEYDKPEQPSVVGQDDGDDARTPLQRFRTPPKKPLSVTDFVSPAWCELQYWYSLTRYGRVRRTPAMKAGTKIHKEKEREVHTEVPIEVRTREDRMGLRLWNIIQGLRILRSNGLTRELEVFGLIDGELVIGIIDEITSSCPDEETEASILDEGEEAGVVKTRRRKEKREAAPTNQRSMKDFLHSSQPHDENVGDHPLTSFQERPSTHYLVDIKTRGVRNLPHERQMKPTLMQLMMYRQMLVELATNKVDASRVFQRYRLDQDTPFSDTFIAELANMDPESPYFEADEAPPIDSLDEITSHNTLSSLWALMIEEFGRTLPVRNSSSVISPLLTAEYRSAKRGDLLGRKSFGFNAKELSTHVATTLKWWRGERPAKGVEIEDAWKCGICEFAEGCTWRANKIEEATQKARINHQTRSKSSI